MKRFRGPLILFSLSVLMFGTTVTVFSYIINKNNLHTTGAQALNGDVAWRAFDGGVDDPGANYSESILTKNNVGGMQQLWKATLPITADDAVVEEPNVSTSSGVIDLVFVNTVKGNLIAYNAANGAKIWEADPSAADYNGQGTKSTPAIDPSGNYIYAYAVDGYIHKYNIATGAQINSGGFPAQATLLPNDIEKGSASLNIANGYIYMTISGNDGDYGHYVGHIVAVNLSSGTETVWNAECATITSLLFTSGGNYCANTQAGIWARPGVKIDPVTGNVFVTTGNGNYNANSGGHNWGDSVVELKPDLSQIVDSYTPASYSNLDSADADLGSTAPVILPKQNGSNTPYLVVQAGKDDIIRLLNRTNLSGQGGAGHIGGELQTITISNEVHEQPAVWTDGNGVTWVYVTDESGDLYAYKVTTTGGTTSLVQAYHQALGTTSSPFVANGVLYIDAGNILALDATTGAKLFGSNTLSISLTQHWESPIVVNGTLFTPDDKGNLYALYVPGATPAPSPSPSPSPTPSTPASTNSGHTTTTSTPAKATTSPPPSPTTQNTTRTTAQTTAHTSTLLLTPAQHTASHTPTTFLSRITRALQLERVSNFVHTSIVTHNWLALGILTVILLAIIGVCSICTIWIHACMLARQHGADIQEGNQHQSILSSITALRLRIHLIIARLRQRS